MESPKPRTPLQRKTSRLNGSRSKGPTSLLGRSRSSRNGLSHGLTAKRLRLEHEDTPEEHVRFCRLVDELNPQTVLQAEMVERIDDAIVQRKRCRRNLHGTLTEQHRV